MEGLLDPTPCVRQKQSQRKQAMDPKGPEGGGARQTEAEPEETQHQVAVVPGSCCTSRIMHACSRHSVPRTPASKAAGDMRVAPISRNKHACLSIPIRSVPKMDWNGWIFLAHCWGLCFAHCSEASGRALSGSNLAPMAFAALSGSNGIRSLSTCPLRSDTTLFAGR